MVYPILLLAGLVGLAVMALLGFVHAPGHHTSSPHSVDVNAHLGHGVSVRLEPNPPGPGHVPVSGAGAGHGAIHGHAGLEGHGAGHHTPWQGHPLAGHAGHAATGHSELDPQDPRAGAPSHATEAMQSGLLKLMPLMSPVNWFSWAVGAGATGMLGSALSIHEPLRAALAVGGAVVFNIGVVRPVWKVILGFASQPAGNLDACVMQTVVAVTRFNTRGEGLVRVVIDGRTEDILARLSAEDASQGPRVSQGERLLIEEIDPRTNSCIVSRC